MERPKYLDYVQGPRLMVGRYCLLDDKNQMRVEKVLPNGMVLLSEVPNFKKLAGPVKINRVKQIERYGVSVYDLKDLPNDVKHTKFEWAVEI
jgi:hypothetical protein